MTAYGFIDAERANKPVRFLCRVRGVSPAAFNAWRAGKACSRRRIRDAALAVHIRAVWKRVRETNGSPSPTSPRDPP